MDYYNYLAIYQYLENKAYPEEMVEEKERRKFREMAKKYRYYQGRLFTHVDPKEQNPLELLHEGNIKEVITQVHKEGHGGINNTWNKLKLQYTAPKLFDHVKEVVKHCDACQFRKKKPARRTVPSKPIMTPSKPFYMIGMDAVGPVIESKRGNRMILVAVDYLTRWPIARAVKDITEETTANFIFEEIVQIYGVPSYLLTDRGSNFTSYYVKSCLKQIHCRHLTTTAFRPQTNGLCERTNQTLVQAIAKLTRDHGETKDWDLMIPSALMALRTMTNDSTGFTPGKLLYGYDLRTPGNWPAPRRKYVEGELQEEIAQRIVNIDQELKTYREEARKKSNETKKKQKERYDRTIQFRKTFQIGETVLMKDNYTSNKFSDKWIGPFTVTKANNSGTYLLIGPNRKRIQGPVNSDQLIPYYCKNTMVPELTSTSNLSNFQTWLERKSNPREVEF
ncbi:hypothetical protein G6F62_006847 [Rhizopus arrhizus]|uniref:Integrase catalytic domain-containing protein n=1 Tax=Rhizopus oryzae TaxID=64495 RepID=A0A9P6WWX3_RHIOR|nr:hypothetical protein G6F64_012750 [Rhizopus arrhizus]KAG1333304.1 hypothetical protein G6F62_006847 [Rhizopus arrhizus]